MTFRGNVVLITGAASGMGRLAAWRLAADGVRVAALDVDEEGLAATARRAPSVQPYACDVTDWDAVPRVVEQVEAELGPLDRVVNAAGVAPTGPLLDQPVEQIRRVMAVNYVGTVQVTKATLPAMLERGRGDLVNFGSLAGWVPSPTFGAYSATKSAVVTFTEILAHENAGRGVRFCCACPPLVETPMLEQVSAGSEGLLDSVTAIRPEIVIDAIERGLDRGDLFVFPGPGSRALWQIRRFLPGLLWKRVHQAMEDARLDAGSGVSVPDRSAG